MRQEDLANRLIVDERRLIVAFAEQNEAPVAWVETLINDVIDNRIDVVVFDPVRGFHALDENSNDRMEVVAEAFAKVAKIGNCAVHLVHWTRKTNGEEVTVEHSRGAIALIYRARSARALNPMSRGEAKRAGVDEQRRGWYPAST